MRSFLAVVLVGLLVSFPVLGDTDRDGSEAQEDIAPNQVEDVLGSAYRLYVRIEPPGKIKMQTLAFCSASFFELPDSADDRVEGTYGTTAGHCTLLFQQVQRMIEGQIWGMEMKLVLDPQNKGNEFHEVEIVDHGFRQFQHWRECQRSQDRDCKRPDMDALDDWAVLKVSDEVDVNTIPLGDVDSVLEGDRVHIAGYPMALGKFWSEGSVTTNYSLPGSFVDGYLATDYVATNGSSGSVVTTYTGEQIGIHVAGIPGGPGLAVPIDRIDVPYEPSNSNRKRIRPLNPYQQNDLEQDFEVLRDVYENHGIHIGGESERPDFLDSFVQDVIKIKEDIE